MIHRSNQNWWIDLSIDEVEDSIFKDDRCWCGHLAKFHHTEVKTNGDGVYDTNKVHDRYGKPVTYHCSWCAAGKTTIIRVREENRWGRTKKEVKDSHIFGETYSRRANGEIKRDMFDRVTVEYHIEPEIVEDRVEYPIREEIAVRRVDVYEYGSGKRLSPPQRLEYGNTITKME